MALTHINCHYVADSGAGQGAAAFVALTPMGHPGTIVAAGSTALRENIGSQVACKLAIEHFVESILDDFTARDKKAPVPADDHDKSVDVLEAAFRRANSSVYSFGHKLAAGGRMAASLMGVVLADRAVAAARVGEGCVYLLRHGEMFPFFEVKPPAAVAEQAQEQLVGAHSLVSVEVASVPLEADDLIVILSRTPSQNEERRLPIVGRNLDLSGGENVAETISRRVFESGDPIRFALVVHVGPEVIYLQKSV